MRYISGYRKSSHLAIHPVERTFFRLTTQTSEHTAAMTTLDMLLGAEESLNKSKTAQQLTYIMLVAGNRWCWMNGSRIQSINA